jgi:hypothetical protein
MVWWFTDLSVSVGKALAVSEQIVKEWKESSTSAE